MHVFIVQFTTTHRILRGKVLTLYSTGTKYTRFSLSSLSFYVVDCLSLSFQSRRHSARKRERKRERNKSLFCYTKHHYYNRQQQKQQELNIIDDNDDFPLLFCCCRCCCCCCCIHRQRYIIF